ncbi:hypothetical protein BH09MYX1_BH09MYX1_17330 [soil metagenome]
MGIVGERPESGLRLTLTLDGGAYSGEATTPSERHPVRVTIGAADSVDVAIEGPAANDVALTEKIRLIVRSVVKHARADERSLPRSIQRWRP